MWRDTKCTAKPIRMYTYEPTLHGIDNKLKTILRIGALAVIWSPWLCRNDRIFSDKNFTCLQVIYRCMGIFRSCPSNNGWNIEAFLWRRVHDWKRRRGIFLSNMG